MLFAGISLARFRPWFTADSVSSALLSPPAVSRRPRVRTAPMPALENGDHLHVAEFLRRYEAASEVKKAQLIEGTVQMPSPVRADLHGKPDNLIQGWLFTFTLLHPELEAYTNVTLLLDSENAPQPDAILCSAPQRGGRVWLNEKGYLCGAPELVCEIAASSASIDLHEKHRAYCRAGVSEYLVWLTVEKKVIWYVQQDSEFVSLKPDAKGRISSRVFPGLVLDTKALLRLDRAAVIEALGRSMRGAV
jgi:Uma2 family endonuclease